MLCPMGFFLEWLAVSGFPTETRAETGPRTKLPQINERRDRGFNKNRLILGYWHYIGTKKQEDLAMKALAACLVLALCITPGLATTETEELSGTVTSDPERKARVTIVSAEMKDGTFAGDVRGFDVDTDDPAKVKAAVDRFMAGEFDIIFLRGVLVPWNACDDLSECAEAVEETCGFLGETAQTAVLNSNSGNCEGTCSNGRGVSIECSVLPSR